MPDHNNIKSDSYQRLKVFLIIFRWASLLLGFILTGFGKHSFTGHPLPVAVASSPVLIILIQVFYQSSASFFSYRYDNGKFNRAIIIFLDLCVGVFMAWFYGLPFFLLSALLPALETALFFGSFVSAIILLITLAICVPLTLSQILRNITPSDNQLQKILQKGIWDSVILLFFSSAIIYLNYLWAIKNEEDVIQTAGKFQHEKNLLFEEHLKTRNECKQALTEITRKEEIISNLNGQLEKLKTDVETANKDIDSLLEEHDALKNQMEESQQASLQNQTRILIEQKEFLGRKEEEYILKLEEMEKHIEELEDEIVRKENMSAGMTLAQQNHLKEKDERIADLEGKINILVGKLSDMTATMKARESLFESFQKVNESINLDNTYLSILQRINSICPSQTAIIFIRDMKEDESDLYYAEAAATPYQNLFIDYSVQMGDGPVGWSLESRKTLVIANGTVKIDGGQQLSTLIRYEKSALILPISHQDDMIGAIYLGRPGENAFTDKEIYLMKSFGRIASISINTALQFEKITSTTLFDDVTGLYNHSFFQERLKNEVFRSRRYNIPVTLALFEILNYQEFSHKTGKNTNNNLIRDLAEILKTSLRETDLAGRLAGGRFAILFIHSGKTDSMGVVERIKMTADMRSFGTKEARESGLKLAVGLSSYPEDAQDKETLFDTASERLTESIEKKGAVVFSTGA